MSAPTWMHPDEPSIAEGARLRLKKIPRLRFGRKSTTKTIKIKHPTLPDEPDVSISIDFKDNREHHDDDDRSRDIFRWAILYENQRGLTIFSTPYYSSRSLLPRDPRPFTEPDSGPSTPSSTSKRSANVTPATYTLPDPTWRWVSKSWLVDMRGDGDVQHDGFEYNWFFRRTNWRPGVGWLSAGGFVRRRRWVRLMMRPSETRRQAEAAIEDRARTDVAGTPDEVRGIPTPVWRGDLDDWSRVHAALKAQARDGPRLELWAQWLAEFGVPLIREHPRVWTEDSVGPSILVSVEKIDMAPKEGEHPRREWISTVLQSHVAEICDLFIYPDSRDQFRDMILRAGFTENNIPGMSKGGLFAPDGF